MSSKYYGIYTRSLNHHYSRDTKIGICKTFTRPTLSDGSESWAIITNGRSLRSAEMCFTRTVRYTLSDCTSKKENYKFRK